MSTNHETLSQWLETMRAEIAMRDAALINAADIVPLRPDCNGVASKYAPAHWE